MKGELWCGGWGVVVYAYAHTHEYMHMHIHMNTCIYTYTWIRAYAHTHEYDMNEYSYMSLSLSLYIYIYIYIYTLCTIFMLDICVNLCMYIIIYVWPNHQFFHTWLSMYDIYLYIRKYSQRHSLMQIRTWRNHVCTWTHSFGKETWTSWLLGSKESHFGAWCKTPSKEQT